MLAGEESRVARELPIRLARDCLMISGLTRKLLYFDLVNQRGHFSSL